MTLKISSNLEFLFIVFERAWGGHRTPCSLIEERAASADSSKLANLKYSSHFQGSNCAHMNTKKLVLSLRPDTEAKNIIKEKGGKSEVSSRRQS